MDNVTYYCSSDYTPLTSSKSTRKAAHSAIDVGHADKLPKDYLIWSLCNTLYVNFCCLGFLALIYSIKTRDQQVLGNVRAAAECSEKAKWYNILASGWNLMVPVLILGFLVLLVLYLRSTDGSFQIGGHGGFQSFLNLFRR
ncbi:interferon-induced transmembrane protein 5-like [Denticeps clupeoides]|uniref:Interferon-induced transmembrane protein 5 n=1 Tax=Denticeps clupeoides TaxID=299321 RepID=A0AAY4EPA6_9TELE|nr:interferon-induced transmembrane protein 5-like [Denticeps clupeoides]